EKESQLRRLAEFHERHAGEAPRALARLRQVVIDDGNVFEELMRTVRVCSLGQITNALFEVGGQYRRSMLRRCGASAERPMTLYSPCRHPPRMSTPAIDTYT